MGRCQQHGWHYRVDGDNESGDGNNDDLMTTIHFVFNVDIQAVGRCQQQGWHDVYMVMRMVIMANVA